MSGRTSSATEKALRLVANGASQSFAARRYGLAISTVWRAWTKARQSSKPAPVPEARTI